VHRKRVTKRARLTAVMTLSRNDELSILASDDLSTTGAFFPNAVPYPVGTEVELSFQLPGDDGTIRCLGEVVAVGGGVGMDLKFRELLPADQRRIRRFTETYGKAHKPKLEVEVTPVGAPPRK
jgi:hypothetical protein